MTVIGYRKSNFKAPDGTEVKGYNVYLSHDIDPRYGSGVQADHIYLTDTKLDRWNIDITQLVGHTVKLYYNRYGKVDGLNLVD